MDSASSKAEDGSVSISELIADRKRDPKKAAALERARKRIADAYIVDAAPTLAVLRMQKGMSQADLAHKMEVSQPYIAKIERGDDNFGLDTIDKLATALEIDSLTIFKLASESRKQGIAR